MAVAKVIFKSSASATPETWMDATTATAAAADITSPKTAMLADGEMTTGTGSGGGGTTEADEKDVNFIDYDGAILYSYTASEAQALTALPANPSHSGLTAQGWNWTLADIKTQLTSVGGKVWVGQMYITESEETEIDIDLDDFTLSPDLSLAVNGSVEVDWGDSSSHSTITGSSLSTKIYTRHTYQASGKYTIKIALVSGSYCFSTYLFGKNPALTSAPQYTDYQSRIINARLGDGINTIEGDVFYYCVNMETITIPKDVRISSGSGVANVFRYCRSLKSIVIPYGQTTASNFLLASCTSMKRVSLPSTITSLGNYTFYDCSGFSSVTLPYSLTSIGTYFFQQGFGLREVFIPSGITTIGAATFYACPVLRLHILGTNVSLSNTNAFNSNSPNLIIYVPYSADHSILSAYKSTTNWSTFASYIQEEPQ